MACSIITHQQRAWLLGELDAWCQSGIISTDQGNRILACYESPAEISERQRSRALFVLMALSASLIGLAVLLFFAFNWEAMPAALKLVLIFGTLGGTYAAAFHLRYRRQARQLSEAVFFLGCLFYGAAIWLIAQIFHLNAHFPDGLWWWAVGVLPFALCLDTLLLHTLLVGLLAVWTGTEMLGFPHLGGWLFGRWWFLPNGCYSLPLLALPGFIWAYRKGSPTTVGLYAPLLAWWFLLQPYVWRLELEANIIYLIGALGGLLLIIAESHPEGSLFTRPYRWWGMLVTAGVLVPLSFYKVNEDIVRRLDLLGGFAITGVILLVTGMVLALAVALQRRAEGAANPFIDRLGEFVHRQWLPVAVQLFFAFCASWGALWVGLGTRGPGALLPTILANAGLVVLALWLMRLGLHEDRGIPFAGGVVMFLGWAVMRYIDLFGNFGGMLGASLMFFLCGAALFGVAVYWRKRKEL